MKGVKGVFNEWQLRIFVVSSMILQMILILWTHLRKRTSTRPIRIVWLVAFLAADSIASLSLGIIFRANMSTKASNSPHNKYLLAIWAPFMLLHQGRHSRITAFSLGENEFWLGHLIRFIYFELTALCICFLAWRERQFHKTSILLFIMGTIRYSERVLALKLGSLNGLKSFNNFSREDPALNAANENEQADPHLSEANKKGELDLEAFDSHTPWTVVDVYRCFDKYKGIYTDIFFKHGGSEENERDLTTMGWSKAFEFMTIELSFAYDLFYTKSVCADTVWGWVARCISLSSICLVLALFTSVSKQAFLGTDVGITYCLLIIALILELWCFMESIMSYRTSVLIGAKDRGRTMRTIEESIEWLRNFVIKMKKKHSPAPHFSVGQVNLLQFCFNDQRLRPWQKHVLKFLEAKEFWDHYYFTTYIAIDGGEIRSRIFSGVLHRLREENEDTFFSTPIRSSLTSHLPENRNFHKLENCLLIWHLSTDLCHRSIDQPCSELQNAKILSDYMLYLLVLHPSLLAPLMITTELTSYQNLFTELVEFYGSAQIVQVGLQVHNDLNDKRYDMIMDGLAADSLLRDAIMLARVLKQMWINDGQAKKTWELVFEVWVDMLGFAACWSGGKQHAELLGKGEELITYVRLFMSHCGDQFTDDIV